MSFQIPDADTLVTYLLNFTGSSDTTEIKQCIFLAELAMRNIELPVLRSDPYAAENIGTTDEYGNLPIPPDMNKPILFFNQGTVDPNGQNSSAGPWLVYDRIGDRDIITQSLVSQYYLSPANVPAVIRGKFSEVANFYKFLPFVGSGAKINMYYYKAWPLLFTPVDGGGTVQNNGVLSTWSEGYVYGSLHEYYVKRHSPDDAAMYKAKFDNAWDQVEDQNNKGKWSGGHTRFTSVWQPRQYRNYNIR